MGLRDRIERNKALAIEQHLQWHRQNPTARCEQPDLHTDVDARPAWRRGLTAKDMTGSCR